HKVEFEGWREGRAAHTFREKFGVWPRGLQNVSKPPSLEVERFIQKRLRAFLYKKRIIQTGRV
ncbi:hypothetical protein EBQ81_04845, partial [bacterium]|nr:hypothetical protein [bacterium]